MKIVSQNHFNECGVCVANMLINYYDKEQIDKKDLLNECNLGPNGLTLLELELLCEKHGIKLDSYQLEWPELFEAAQNNQPFVTIFEHNNVLHYVVGKIQGDTLQIFDPINRVYSFKKANPPANWLGIVCFSKYSRIKFKPIKFENINIFKSFSPISWVFIICEVLEFVLSITLSLFMSKVMNLNQNNIMTTSIWKISFLFLAILVLNELFSFLNFLIKNWYFKNIYKLSTYSFFQSLITKKLNFYKNYSRFEIIQLYDFLSKIIHFKCFFLSDFFSEVIISCFSLIIIILFQYQMFILVLVSIFLLLLVYSLQLFINKKALKKMFLKQIEVQENINNFLVYKATNNHYFWDASWINQICFQIDNFYKNNLSYMYKKELIKMSLSVLTQLINFVILILVWSTQDFLIGKLFILLSLFSIFNKSINNCLNTITNYWSLKPIIQKFNEMSANNNANNNFGITFELIDSLQINQNIFKKNLCIYSVDLTQNKDVNNLLNLNSHSANTISINTINLSQYSNNFLLKSIFLIDANNTHFYNDWKSLIPKNHSLYRQIISFIQKQFSNEIFLTKYSELSIEFRAFLLLVSCLEFNNKILCLNNIFDHLSSQYYEMVQDIFTDINQTNFVIANVNQDTWLGLYENLI